jgi:hypothetical protein
VAFRELLDLRHEGDCHRRHQCCGCELVAAMEAEECRRTCVALNPGHVDVQVHSVDGLYLQRDVFVQYFGHRSW